MKPGVQLPLNSVPKWVKIGLLVLVMLILVGVVLNVYLSRLIDRQLKESVHKGSNGLYTLDYQTAEVNIFKRSIVVEKASLKVDTALASKRLQDNKPVSVFLEGNFSSIRLQGIHWLKFLFSKELRVGEFFIQSPNLTVNYFKSGGTDSLNDKLQVERMVQLDFKEFKVSKLEMRHANVDYRYHETGRAGPTFYFFKDMDLTLRDLSYSKIPKDSSKKFSIGGTDLKFGEYEYRTGDSLYLMGIKDLKYSSEKRTITVSNFYIRPRLSEKGYSKQLQYQRERNDVNIQQIKLEGVEMGPMMENGELNIQQATIGEGYWKIYLSRIPPLPPRRDNVVPSQPLLNISSKVSIANLKVNKLQLNYREYNTESGETGEIHFNDVSGTVTNITNERKRIEKNPHLVVNLAAKLMGTGDFKARFDFLLDDTTGKFSVEAKLGRIDATRLNSGFIALNKVEIKKGVIDEMNCKGWGNENNLRGNVGMLYHDLHIAVLKKDGDTLKRRGLVSLVANVLVKNDNPKEDEPIRKAENIVLKRDSRKSYFNLLWMALFEGIVKIVAA